MQILIDDPENAGRDIESSIRRHQPKSRCLSFRVS